MRRSSEQQPMSHREINRISHPSHLLWNKYIYIIYDIVYSAHGNQSANGSGPRKLATEYFYKTKTYLNRIDSFRSVNHQCMAHKHIMNYILTRRDTVVHSVYQRQSSFTKQYSARAFVCLSRFEF